MPLTLTDYQSRVTHALGGSPASQITSTQIVNEAGREFCGSHEWKFLERSPLLIRFTAPLTITGATWTESSKTITKTGGFTSFTYSPGNIFTVSGGTGATAGDYVIASRTSADAIVLSTSIGSDADGQIDIDGSIPFPYVDLPADFESLITIERGRFNLSRFQLVDFHEFCKLQAAGAVVTPGGLFGTIVFPGQSAVTANAGVPRLLLYPTPSEDQADALRIFYRAGWTELATGTDVPNLPLYCETMLTRFVQSVALGYEEPDVATVEQRIETIIGSPSFMRLIYRSGLSQSDYGPETNGATRSQMSTDFITEIPAIPS